MTDAGRGKGRGSALLAMLKKTTESTPGVQSPPPEPESLPGASVSPPMPLRPRGRASLLDKLVRSAPTALPGQLEPATPTAAGPASGGRGRLLAAAIASPQATAPAAVAPRVGAGRASLMGIAQKLGATTPPVHPSTSFDERPGRPHAEDPVSVGLPAPAKPMLSGDGLGVTGSLAGMTLDSRSLNSGSSGPISRMGSDGKT